MIRTPIEWTDFTANPLKFRAPDGQVVWACAKVSAGCTHCYAETLAKRWGRGGPFNAGRTEALTPFLDEQELRQMLTYKPAAGHRCFVGDMTDVFGEWVADEQLDRLFGVLALRGSVTWQVLTKRADRMAAYFSAANLRDRIVSRAIQYADYFDGRPEGGLLQEAFLLEEMWQKGMHWPLPNVWLGVSCEDQAAADARIPLLLQTPAAIRFISAEPLLGPISLGLNTGIRLVGGTTWTGSLPILDWIIVGGESGPGARVCQVNWVRDLVDQARGTVPVFVKQLGSTPLDWDRAEPTGRTNPETGNRQLQVRLADLKSRKGSDPAEWPEDLRVRQFPAIRNEVPA